MICSTMESLDADVPHNIQVWTTSRARSEGQIRVAV